MKWRNVVVMYVDPRAAGGCLRGGGQGADRAEAKRGRAAGQETSPRGTRERG